MIPRTHRLNQAQVLVLKQTGLTLKTRYHTFLYAPSPASVARFAVIITKKLLPLAVARNHYRRLVYDTVRPFLVSGLSVIIIPHHPIPTKAVLLDIVATLTKLCLNKS
jgi:ribonuclease P protein component